MYTLSKIYNRVPLSTNARSFPKRTRWISPKTPPLAMWMPSVATLMISRVGPLSTATTLASGFQIVSSFPEAAADDFAFTPPEISSEEQMRRLAEMRSRL